jgi:hypothetical protein
MEMLGSPADTTIRENEAGKGGGADQHWQTAGDRVLLYLRCLNFPTTQAFELALRALKAAERSMSLGSGNSPVVEAMQALHQLLSEQESGIVGHSHSLATWRDCVIPPSPPLHRLPMVPEGV